MSEERWFDFHYQYLEAGCFDYEDRPKTLEAMRKLAENIPDNVRDNLPPIIVFAPSPAKLGEAHPWATGDAVLIYLSPQLESKTQREVNFTVAHEFAHVALGHCKPGFRSGALAGTPYSSSSTERDADRLAESWGFARPKAQKRGAR